LPVRQPASFPWGTQYLNCDSIVHFARGVGAARSGKLEIARAEIVEQERVLNELVRAKRETYWIAQAETQLLTTRAWILLAAKNSDEAIALMQRATELEATADKEAVTPGEVLPAGDLLGDMLLEVGRPGDALAAFEAVLAASPNRLNSLYGAGLAAERAGNTAKAKQYYEQMVKLAVSGDSGIPRIEYARAFVAGTNPH
jgi:tetratricopeptide (TPR) repeat protein